VSRFSWITNNRRFSFAKDSRFRPPSWRYLMAQQLADGRQRLSFRVDDRRTREAARLLRALDRCPGAAGQRRQALRRPELLRAWQVHTAADPFPRWALEAWLLTDEPLGRVARECDLPLQAVEWYHEVFFHVRDRYEEDRSYVYKQVIGPPQDGDAGRTWSTS
jgi:hypothetical protein